MKTIFHTIDRKRPCSAWLHFAIGRSRAGPNRPTMFNRVKTTPNSPMKSIQIVEFFREGKKVQQHIVRHVGIAMDADEEGAFRQLAEHITARMLHKRRPGLFPPVRAGPRWHGDEIRSSLKQPSPTGGRCSA